MTNQERLNAMLKGFTESGKGPAGCACALAKGGKTLYEGYFGYADRENHKPIDPDTVYRMFSMTKVIVCSAAMTLFERGKFLLNEPLYEYLPEFKNSTKFVRETNDFYHVEPVEHPILIKHAFSMSNGIPYGNDNSFTGREVKKVQEQLKKGKYTLADEVRALASVPLQFEPGTHWVYGHGHDLVARLIEVISGKTVGEFLREEIFEPLGMESTGYRYFGDIEQRMATFYERAEDGTLTAAPGPADGDHQKDATHEGGGSGLFSTVGDYLKFTQMLANGGTLNGERILGRKTIDLMRCNQLSDEQIKDFRNSYLDGYGYGLGVRMMMDRAGGNSNSSVGEFGWTGMIGTWTSIDPSEGFSCVYMHQMFPNMEEYHHLRARAAAYAFL